MQRCAVKSLEALRAHNDGTVRQQSDLSLVQTAYGEDGVDVTRASFMGNLAFMAENADVYKDKFGKGECLGGEGG